MLLNDMHTDWDNVDNDTRDAIATLHTAGDGYWSDYIATVRVTELRIGYVSEDYRFGELCIHFNTDDWRVNKHGLIYTDNQFMQELREYLTSIGLDGADIDYSEQGMQGDNYVSCDVGADFIASYKAQHPEKLQVIWEEING